MTDEVKSMKSKILEAMDMAEAAQVEALKSEVVSLESKIDEMQSKFEAALKAQSEAFEAMLNEKLHPVAEKSEEEATEEEVEEQVEETTEEEVEETPTEEEVEVEEVAEKGESKAEPVHDNLQAEKSKPVNVYEIMGRNHDGTAKRH